MDPFEKGEDEHAVCHLVAGPGEVYWDILTAGGGEGGNEVSEETDLQGGELPPVIREGGLEGGWREERGGSEGGGERRE